MDEQPTENSEYSIDIMAMDEGRYCRLLRPKELTEEEYEEFQYWIVGILRQARRRVSNPKYDGKTLEIITLDPKTGELVFETPRKK